MTCNKPFDNDNINFRKYILEYNTTAADRFGTDQFTTGAIIILKGDHMPGWKTILNLIREELQQRTEEGCNVEGYAEQIEQAGTDETRLSMIYQAMLNLPIRSDFPVYEPSDLEMIRAEHPAGPRHLTADLNEAAWRDKFLGAWLGRCAGCALGKPVERWPFMNGAAGNPGWKNVQLWYEGANAWPIDGYVHEHSLAEISLGLETNVGCQPCTREHIQFMMSDDDIRYTVIGLMMLE